MKLTGTMVIGAGCLFALVAPLAGQEDQPLRYRSSRAQGTPGAPLPGPPLRQRFPSDREMSERPRTVVPDRTAAPGPPGLRAPSTPVTPPPPRPKTRKSRTKTHGSGQPQGKNSDQRPESATTRKEHDAVSDRHESERTTPSPLHATPAPVTTPSRAPAPPVAPAIAPPVYATPFERAGQMPGPPAMQQTPSRIQRPTLNDLSEDERARLHSAHQTALQHDPNLAASRARYLNARKEFRQKLRDALLKADPSVQPILEKIRRDKPEDHD
jgi:hypothetical protein